MSANLQRSFGTFQQVETGLLLSRIDGAEDVEMADVDPLRKLIIAVDFGTTFSSVAYARITESMDETAIAVADVHCIARYPEERPYADGAYAYEPREDVPTELWYPTEGSEWPRVEIELALDQYENETGLNLGTFNELAEDSEDDELQNSPTPQASDQENREVRPFWGYEVQQRLRESDIPKDNRGRIDRFKLMLDEKEQTETIRQTIAPILKALKGAKLIKSNTDVITEYLFRLFLHTKNELQARDDVSESIPVDFVLCVPAVWPSKACRTMQSAMAVAAERVGLGTSPSTTINNLFIISEPEAAAMCVLKEHDNEIRAGETIVVVDAGGGTVDATTYLVDVSDPLRFSDEAVAPGTEVCGASFINERLRTLLLDKLKDEVYLVVNGKTIKSIVEAKVIEFENTNKRNLDVTDKNARLPAILIDDLQQSSSRGLASGRIHFSRKELEYLFGDSLYKSRALLKRQLDDAKANEYSVTKVILIGGFGRSPSLQGFLRKYLAKETNFNGGRIEFLVSRASSTVVARGAVLRALNKDQGPKRVIMCSYGFLRAEPHEPQTWEAHRNVKPRIDKADGERYVYNTIDWLIQKGTSLDAREEIPMPQKHTFKLNDKRFLCREELYVSDELQQSHYRKSHDMNKSAELAGAIEVDMTFLKDEGHIQPVKPSEWSDRKVKTNYWAVEFDLVMIVEGRNLYYEARWPPSAQSSQVHFQSKGQICIAAAFKPGTA